MSKTFAGTIRVDGVLVQLPHPIGGAEYDISQPLFALPQRILRPLALGDVFGKYGDALFGGVGADFVDEISPPGYLTWEVLRLLGLQSSQTHSFHRSGRLAIRENIREAFAYGIF